MSMTLQQLIDQAVSVASRGMDSSLAPALSAEMIGEDLLGIVFHRVAERAARSRRLRTTLRRTKTLNIANGSTALDADVLTAYLHEANITDPADKTKLYSLVPWYRMTTEELDPRLGHYAVEGESTLHVVEPNTVYDPAAGPTVSLNLTIPCVPEIPATASTVIAVIDEVADSLVEELAAELLPLSRTK